MRMHTARTRPPTPDTPTPPSDRHRLPRHAPCNTRPPTPPPSHTSSPPPPSPSPPHTSLPPAPTPPSITDRSSPAPPPPSQPANRSPDETSPALSTATQTWQSSFLRPRARPCPRATILLLLHEWFAAWTAGENPKGPESLARPEPLHRLHHASLVPTPDDSPAPGSDERHCVELSRRLVRIRHDDLAEVSRTDADPSRRCSSVVRTSYVMGTVMTRDEIGRNVSSRPFRRPAREEVDPSQLDVPLTDRE